MKDFVVIKKKKQKPQQQLFQDFPGAPGGWDSVLPVQGEQV